MSCPGRQQLGYVSGFLDFAGRFAGESSRCARDEEIGVYVGPTEAEPFQSYDTSGTLLPTLSGWADEGVRPTWTVQMSRRIRVCASMLAGEASAPHSSSRTVSSKDARLAPYCNRVPRLRAGTRPSPSLAQKRRSFRMTTLKVLYWPG